MRIGRVQGTVTLGRKADSLPAGNLLLVEVLDDAALTAQSNGKVAYRKSSEPQALVVFDQLGAGRGQLIAISEGREATAPFAPNEKPIDAYNAAILDTVEYRP